MFGMEPESPTIDKVAMFSQLCIIFLVAMAKKLLTEKERLACIALWKYQMTSSIKDSLAGLPEIFDNEFANSLFGGVMPSKEKIVEEGLAAIDEMGAYFTKAFK